MSMKARTNQQGKRYAVPRAGSQGPSPGQCVKQEFIRPGCSALRFEEDKEIFDYATARSEPALNYADMLRA